MKKSEMDDQKGLSRRAARNALSLMLSVGVDRLASFIIILYIGRILGVSYLGDYGVVMSLLNIFQTLTMFGQNQIVLREVSRDRELAGSHLVNSGFLLIVTSLLFMLVMNGLVRLLGYDPAVLRYTWVAGLALLPYSLMTMMEAIIQALERMKFVAIGKAIGQVVMVVSALTVMAMGYDLRTVFAVIGIGWALTALVYVAVLTRLGVRIPLRLDSRFLRHLLSLSWTFVLLGAFGMAFKQADVLMLSRLGATRFEHSILGFIPVPTPLEGYNELSKAITGYYTAAYKLAQIGQMILPALVLPIVPSLSRRFLESPERFSRLSHRAARLLLVVILPVAVGVTFYADLIIQLAYGDQYAGSVSVLRILIWMLVSFYANAAFYRTIIASNNEVASLRIALINTVFTVILNYFLIPLFGAVGAAVVWVATVALGLFQNYIFIHRRVFRVRLGEVLLKPLVCAGFMAGSLFALLRLVETLQLEGAADVVLRLLVLLVAGGIYLLALWLTKTFTRQDIALGRRILHSILDLLPWRGRGEVVA
jgi:O-antigen/teichoic acid export membrane protein